MQLVLALLPALPLLQPVQPQPQMQARLPLQTVASQAHRRPATMPGRRPALANPRMAVSLHLQAAVEQFRTVESMVELQQVPAVRPHTVAWLLLQGLVLVPHRMAVSQVRLHPLPSQTAV